MNQRPAATEYHPYYETYVGQVPDGDILETLRTSGQATLGLIAPLNDEQADHRYAPEKWSVKQVLGHISDMERVFAYRALSFARRIPDQLPGVDQDLYARNANFDGRGIAEIREELATVRAATLSLFESLTEELTRLEGVASDCPFTVRAIQWIVAGHEMHHRKVIRERYL